MQMTEGQLNAISLRSFFNKLTGFRKLEKDAWERVRAQTYLLLQPNIDPKSPLTPQEVFPLPWDGEITEKVKVDAKAEAEKRAKIWNRIDKK